MDELEKERGKLNGDDPFADESRAEEERLRALLALLRAEHRAPASLQAAVMRRVRGSRRSLWAGFRSWAFTPRMVPVSPALAAGLGMVAILFFLLRPSGPAGEIPRAAAGGDATVPTRFVLVAPEAGSVSLTGDFVEWNREGIRLEELRGTGVWTADVALPPGVYEYVFVVDGSEWVADPGALSYVDDGFGDLNSVLIVAPDGEA